MRKRKVKKDKQPYAEHRIRTKYRIRLGAVYIAPGETIAVATNRGFDGKQDLGYYFFHSGKKIYLRKKDVDYVGRFEY